MGTTGYPTGVQDRVFQSPSRTGSTQVNSGPSGPRSTPRSRKRNLWSSGKKSNLHRRRVSFKAVPVIILPNTEKTGHMEADYQPQTLKQGIHSSDSIQDGNSSLSYSVSGARLLGYIDRSKGCLPPHPNTSVSSQVPGLSIQGSRLLFPGSSLRTFHRTKSLHKGHKGRPCFPQKTRYHGIRLSGRLASGRSLGSGVSSNNDIHRDPSSESRLDSQSSEVLPNSQSDSYLLGRSTRLYNRDCHSVRSEGTDSSRYVNGDVNSAVSASQAMASSSGAHGQYGRCDPVLPSIHETYSDSSTQSFHALQESAVQESSGGSIGQRTPYLVDAATQCGFGEIIQGRQSQHHHHHRCLTHGLGCCLGDGDPVGFLEPRGIVPTHQSSGALCGSSGDFQLGSQARSSPSHDSLRQLHDSLVHQPSGRNQVDLPLSQDVGPSPLVPTARYSHQSHSPGRRTQCDGRRSIQGEAAPIGMVPQPSLGQSHLRSIRQTDDRPLCDASQPQTASVLHEVLSSSSLGDRCSSVVLEQPLPVCVPAMVSHPSGAPQAQTVFQRDASSSGPVLAEPTVVSPPSRDVDRPSIPIPASSKPVDSSKGKNSSSTSATCSTSGLEVITRRFVEEGLSQQAAEVAAGSRRRSTLSTYDSRLARFRDWAADKNVDPLEASVEVLADFFLSLFNEGKQVSTIRNYRSAIALVHRGFPDGSTIGSNTTLSHLLRGMFNRRPPRRRLSPSWSINDVLTSLSRSPFEPMHSSTLEHLTYKTLFLVAAASARRRSELHALTTRRGFIRFSHSGVFLIPDPGFLTKNETISFTPGEIYLPNIAEFSSIPEDKKVCPVRALKWYLDKTKNIRSSERLFLIPRSPYNPAAKDTLARWIVNLITPFTSPDEPIHAHQLRAHAASSAWFKGVSLDDILRAAAWKTPSTFVASYLTDVVSQEGAFARAVLGVSGQRRPGLPPSSRC